MPNYFDEQIYRLRKQLRRAILLGDKPKARMIRNELDLYLALNN